MGPRADKAREGGGMTDDVNFFDRPPELDAAHGGDTVKVPQHVAPTEDAVAHAFAETYAGKFVFDHTAGSWFVWNSSRWTRDLRSVVFHAARVFCRAVRATISDPPSGLAKIAFAAAVERAARSDPKLAVSHEIWDRDPWLLGTPYGVVDLRTGLLLPATPDLYISRHTHVAPAPAGTEAPLWSAFLDAATNHDKDLQDFLYRFCGYALAGDVTEEVVTFLYGPGGNGKGVFLAALTGIMGEYVVSLPVEVFTANTRINLEYYRAQMSGARLVTASETEAQTTWAESQIKEMTGNETPLSARHPYGQPFTFRPQFKICMVGNHAPKLKGRSAAMERRLRVLPFNQTPAKPDPKLKDKLRSEYPAILRKMIEGCLVWQRDRLGTTTAIQAATSAYFEQQDAFRRWIDDCCKLAPGLKLKPGLLLESFNAWARANGEETTNSNAFAELIDRTPGLTRVKSNGARLVEGIGLNASTNRDGRDGE
jgi:putative DNA primase/helicase